MVKNARALNRAFVAGGLLAVILILAFLGRKFSASENQDDALQGPRMSPRPVPALTTEQDASAPSAAPIAPGMPAALSPHVKTDAENMWEAKVANFWAMPQGVASYIARTIESGPADAAMKAFYELRMCEGMGSILEMNERMHREGRPKHVDEAGRIKEIQNIRMIEQQCQALKGEMESNLDGLLRTALQGKAVGAADEALDRFGLDPNKPFDAKPLYPLVWRDALKGDSGSVVRLATASPDLTNIDDDEFRAIIHAFKEISRDPRMSYESSSLVTIEESINMLKGVSGRRQFPGKFSHAAVPEPVTPKGLELKRQLVAAMSCKAMGSSCPNQ